MRPAGTRVSTHFRRRCRAVRSISASAGAPCTRATWSASARKPRRSGLRAETQTSAEFLAYSSRNSTLAECLGLAGEVLGAVGAVAAVAAVAALVLLGLLVAA